MSLIPARVEWPTAILAVVMLASYLAGGAYLLHRQHVGDGRFNRLDSGICAIIKQVPASHVTPALRSFAVSAGCPQDVQ